MKKQQNRFIGIGTVAPDPNWGMPAHGHDFNELIIVLDGLMTVTLGKSMLKAAAGDILNYRAGTVHREQSDPRHPVRTYFITWQGNSRYLPLKRNDSGGRIRFLAEWLYLSKFTPSPNQKALAQAYFALIFQECLRVGAAAPHPVVERVNRFILNNLERPLDLADLSKIAHMEKHYFVRFFRQTTGTTPMKQVWGMRLEAARDVLRRTAAPIKEVAAHCGFANPYHFSRLFKRRFGMPPGLCRRK